MVDQKQTTAFVQQLLQKKSALEEQLEAVNKILETEGYVTNPRHKWDTVSPITKVAALERVLRKATSPLRVAQLIPLMEEEGFKFNTTNKSNALNNLLYARKIPWLDKTPEGFVMKK